MALAGRVGSVQVGTLCEKGRDYEMTPPSFSVLLPDGASDFALFHPWLHRLSTGKATRFVESTLGAGSLLTLLLPIHVHEVLHRCQ